MTTQILAIQTRTTQSEKSWLSRSRAWISILLIVPVGAVVAFSEPSFSAASWGSFCFDVVGWSCFFGGALFRWWATLYIGGRKDRQLVCHGPYSVTRNPLYFGTFLMVLSIAFFVHSLFFALAMATVAGFYVSITVPDEERRLSHLHGAAFEQYSQRVPKFFPRFALYQSSECIQVKIQGLRSELYRSLRWACIPVLCELFLHLRVQEFWPHVLYLP